MTVEIPLTRGYVSLVDDKDAPLILAMGKWQAVEDTRTVYAQKDQWNRRRASNNTSGYKGVSWNTDRGRWKVSIRVADGRRLFLGYFDDPLVAALAYDEAARLHHGEFARPNFPEAA